MLGDNDFQQVADDLLRKNYCVINFPYTPLILGQISGFNQFLEKPPDEKYRWNVEAGLTKDPDLGYIEREGEAKPGGGIYDTKEFFHNKSTLITQLERKEIDFQSELPWLEGGAQLRNICVEYASVIMSALEQKLFVPSGTLRDKVRKAHDLHTLRFLSYHQNIEGGFAQSHTDRSGITLHLWENSPGLKLLVEGDDGPRIAYSSQHAKALVFFGRKAAYETNGVLTPLKHAVDKEVEGDRKSFVCFIHTPYNLSEVKTNKEK